MKKKRTNYRISPLPGEIVARVRAERIDSAGHAVVSRLDGERHQCRACLRLTNSDEPVLLISHSPFESRQPYAERGPVFIHERECTPPPDPTAYPAEFPHHDVVLRAYNGKDEIEGAQLVGPRDVEEVIGTLLANPGVAYIHARNSAYGCYMFRIDRTENQSGSKGERVAVP
jgi:hypothetical protein